MTDGTDGGIAPLFWEEARSEMYLDELRRVKMDSHRDEKRVRYLTWRPFNEKIHFFPKDTPLMSKDITIQLRTHSSHGLFIFILISSVLLISHTICHTISHIDKDSILNKITKWEGNNYICYFYASLMWVQSPALHMTSCCWASLRAQCPKTTVGDGMSVLWIWYSEGSFLPDTISNTWVADQKHRTIKTFPGFCVKIRISTSLLSARLPILA